MVLSVQCYIGLPPSLRLVLMWGAIARAAGRVTEAVALDPVLEAQRTLLQQWEAVRAEWRVQMLCSDAELLQLSPLEGWPACLWHICLMPLTLSAGAERGLLDYLPCCLYGKRNLPCAWLLPGQTSRVGEMRCSCGKRILGDHHNVPLKQSGEPVTHSLVSSCRRFGSSLNRPSGRDWRFAKLHPSSGRGQGPKGAPCRTLAVHGRNSIGSCPTGGR